jgi:hypothetical protein
MHRPLLVLLVVSACAPAAVSSLQDGSAPGDSVAAPDVSAPAVDAPVAPADRPGATTDLGDPPWVDVDLRTRGSCPALNACGGDVRGTWDVAGVCLEVPIEGALAQCPGARVTRRGGRARGRVTFGERLALRRAEWSAEVQVLIPAVCASFVGGCPGIQAAVRGVAPDTTCAATAAGDCDCTARQAGGLNDGDGYTTEGAQIVSATLMRRWDYCIEGDALRYRDVSAREPREPGVITLRRAAR